MLDSVQPKNERKVREGGRKYRIKNRCRKGVVECLPTKRKEGMGGREETGEEEGMWWEE